MIYPIELMMACCSLMKHILAKMNEQDGFQFMSDKMYPFKDFNEFIGMAEYQKLEQGFVTEASALLRSLGT